MKKVFVCALITASLAAATLSAKGQEGDQYAGGKTLYQEKCQACHGENGEGNGPMSSAFSPPPANFTRSEFWKMNTDQRIMNVAENGYRLMPPIALTADQARKIVNYMTHIFKK